MRHTLFDANTIKVLRAKCIELSRRVVSLCTLNTAMRSENARLRAEIDRLSTLRPLRQELRRLRAARRSKRPVKRPLK